MPNAALITSRDICNQAVVERILADDSVSSIKISANLQSDTYDGGVISSDPGTVGWRIERNTGDAVFNELVARGDLTISGFVRTGTSGQRIELRPSGQNLVPSLTYFTGASYAASEPFVEAEDQGGGDWALKLVGPVSTAGQEAFILLKELDAVIDAQQTIELQQDGAVRLRTDATVEVLDGSVSNPGLTFIDDDNTGMYRIGTDNLGFATGGSLSFNIQSNQDIDFNSHVLFEVLKVQASDGTVSAPSFTFDNDTNTGMYLNSADVLSLTAGGVEMLRMNEGTSDYLAIGPSGSASQPALVWTGATGDGYWRSSGILAASIGGTKRFEINAQGVDVTDTFGFLNDGDTYITASAANQVSVYLGGSEKVKMATDGFFATEVYNQTTGTAANVTVFSGGQMFRDTSMAKYKDNLRTWEPTDDEWDRLVPYEWESNIGHEAGTTYRGFVWDYLPESYRAESTENLRAIVGALIQRVKALEAA